jgi:Protein of unknown function (DUF3891)
VILREEADGRVLGVSQLAHSALTGRIAGAWTPRRDLPWDELVTAAAIHDLGWTAWEQDPEIDPESGLPYPFFRVPDPGYTELWARGTDAAETFGRWVGLLVSMHCTRLLSRRPGEAAAALVERERARQARLRRELDADEAVAVAASDLLAEWDAISLALCQGKPVDLDPWPFAAERVDLRVDGRELRPPGGGGGGRRVPPPPRTLLIGLVKSP